MQEKVLTSIEDRTQLIKDIRDENKVSQNRLSKKLGYHQTVIGRWEMGHGPTFTAFVDFLDACGYELVVRRKQ